MRFMLLIYENGAEHDAYLATQPGGGEGEMGAYFAYNDQLRAANAYNAAEALHPGNTAISVRVRDGQASHTPGPFAPTHLELGGFYLIDVASHEEALAWAERIPGARSGCVEVRPVVDFGEMPDGE